MLETAAMPNNSGTYIAKTKLALISTYPSMDLLVCLATRAHLGGWTMHGMAWPGMTWHGIAWPGTAWHGMRTTPGAMGGSLPAAPLREPGGPVGGHGGGICVSNRNTYFLQSVVPLAPLA